MYGFVSFNLKTLDDLISKGGIFGNTPDGEKLKEYATIGFVDPDNFNNNITRDVVNANTGLTI